VSAALDLPVAGAGAEDRVGALDGPSAAELEAQGWAVPPGLLTPKECEEVAGLYDGGGRFRSRVVMARHGFGRGEYQYFAYPLPDLVAGLRDALYARLAPVANRWNETMGIVSRRRASVMLYER